VTAIPLAIIGLGKMGRAVEQLASERGFKVVARLARGDAITRSSLNGATVAIEFTEPSAAARNARACLEAGCAAVVGTTGWYADLPALRGDVVRHDGALLTAPNFSLGVAVFSRLVAEAARRFTTLPGFDAHLVEIHHAAKKDAPSGTALLLKRSMEQAGFPRPIDVAASRAGFIPGTHTVGFDGPAETVTLTHTARDRTAFARGALGAAKWIQGKRGWYTMRDVLGIA